MTFFEEHIGVLNEAIKKEPKELVDDMLKAISGKYYGIDEIEFSWNRFSLDRFSNECEFSMEIINYLEDKVEELVDNIIKVASDAGYGVQEIRYRNNKISIEIIGCFENGEKILVFMPREEEK